MTLNEENKNYRNLVNQAEGAFLKKEFLEVFLIQSCVIEGVLKNYASVKLSHLSSQSSIFSENGVRSLFRVSLAHSNYLWQGKGE